MKTRFPNQSNDRRGEGALRGCEGDALLHRRGGEGSSGRTRGGCEIRGWRGVQPAAGRSAFTLIEIMLVVGIFALMIGMGVPSFYQAVKKEPMRKALTGITEACQAARAQAILQGKTVSLSIRPQERTFSVEGGGATSGHPGAGTSGEIADSIGIEMLDVNLIEYREADLAKVRFFPNGTCDEFTLILRSSRNDWIKLAVEPTTGNVSVGGVQ